MTTAQNTAAQPTYSVTQKISPSRKLITTWAGNCKVGIYHSRWSVRLYSDRAIVRMPYVGNTSGCAERVTRVIGNTLTALLAVARQQIADDVDYSERVRELTALELIDYESNMFLRVATEDEAQESIDAARLDGGAGVIIVGGVSCYVL